MSVREDLSITADSTYKVWAYDDSWDWWTGIIFIMLALMLIQYHKNHMFITLFSMNLFSLFGKVEELVSYLRTVRIGSPRGTYPHVNVRLTFSNTLL